MLNKICTNLETSKRLKELGIEGGSFFTWYFGTLTNDWVLVSEDGYVDSFIDPENKSNIPAYTLEQLLEMLPFKLPGGHDSEHLSLTKNMWWNVGYLLRGHNCYQISDYKNEGLLATVAKLLIKLKEDKII